MTIRKIRDGVYNADSSSSSKVYTIRWGTEGQWFSCDCMSYIMNRNKGRGNYCKHTQEVVAHYPPGAGLPTTTGGTVNRRYFEFVGGTSRKFWEIKWSNGYTSGMGFAFNVRWGPIGATGQSKPKSFTTAAQAQKAAEALINEKLGKGYLETGGSPRINPSNPQAPAPAPAAPKVTAPKRLTPMLALELDMTEVATYAKDDDYIFEAKLDGQRIMVVIENGNVTVIGRNGQTSQHCPRFQTGKHAADLAKLGKRTLVLDGELMMETGVLWVFDMASFESGGAFTFGHAEPWSIRHKALEVIFAAWAPDPACYRLLPFSSGTEDKLALLEHQKTNQGEGVIIKKTSAPYQPGVRGKNTMKAKFVHDADLIVTKVNVNGKENAALSAVRDGKLIEVGNCSLIGKPPVKVGDIVVVRYLYLGAGDRIVQPRLMNVRTDKPHAQCTFDQLVGTNKAVVS